MSSQVVILFLYGGHSVHVAVAEFHDSAINLSCLSDISDFPTLEPCARCVSQMFLLILCL